MNRQRFLLRRLGCALAMTACAAAVVPAAALGDAGNPNYRSKLVAVSPKPKGLVVRVVDGDDALELRNTTGRNVMVPGYEGEPYLRFLAGGRVEVNVNSPAKYLNEERYGGVAIPKSASPKSAPRWQPVAQDGRYVWHEHRIHWMSTLEPPKVKENGGKTLTKVFDWNVPVKVGAERVKVTGTLWWVPSGQLERADALIAAAVARQARATEPKPAPAAKPPRQTTEETQDTTTPAEESAQVAAPATSSADSSSSSLPWIIAAASMLALLGVGGYALRRRRHEPAGPKGEVW